MARSYLVSEDTKRFLWEPKRMAVPWQTPRPTHTHTAPFPHDQTIFANQDLLTPVPAENNTLVGIQGFYDKDQNPNWGALLCPHTQAFL